MKEYYLSARKEKPVKRCHVCGTRVYNDDDNGLVACKECGKLTCQTCVNSLLVCRICVDPVLPAEEIEKRRGRK